MLWTVADRGFLPDCQPLTTLPIGNYKNTQLVYTLENLVHNLPHYLSSRRWREEMIYELRQSAPLYGHNAIDALGSHAEYERVLLLFGMFANAYVFALHETPLKRVPKEVSIPLAKAAHLCQRQPLINYTSYVLYNWQRSGEDVEIINTFTDTGTEKSIIKAFVESEFDFSEFLKRPSVETLSSTLQKILDRFRKLRWETSVEEFNLLSGLYQDFKEVLYEGWQHKPITYECNPFAQAAFLSATYRLLGVDKDALLHQAEDAIRIYRHSGHNNYILSMQPMNVVNIAGYKECLNLLADIHNEMFMVCGAEPWKAVRTVALKNCVIRRHLGV
jgi:hypothetical protein